MPLPRLVARCALEKGRLIDGARLFKQLLPLLHKARMADMVGRLDVILKRAA